MLSAGQGAHYEFHANQGGPAQARQNGAAISLSRGHTTGPCMVFLLAFAHIMLPIPFGQYPNQAECERERTALIGQFADDMAAHHLTLVCLAGRAPG
jgi:hypothetical protein